MRLSVVLLRKKMPNGHIWRGKHRLYKEVTPLIAAEVRRKLEIEERNMFLLRHPYLTLEQEQGYMAALGNKGAFMRRIFETRALKFRPHVTLEERLCHLKHNEPWD